MVPTPQLIVKPFAAEASDPADITLPIPVAPTATPGQASFDEGFPPITRADPVSGGGVPPFQQDFNGLFYMITSYLAWLQGGGGFAFDTDFVAENGGYREGAVLQSQTDLTRFWVSTIDDNANDPDDVPTPAGWIPQGTGQGYITAMVPAGTSHDLNPTGWGPSVDVLDIDISAGSAVVTGLRAGYNGQRVVITPVNGGGNTLTLPALTGSSPANQWRVPADMIFLNNNSIQVQYSTGVGAWLVMP
jgi:hypothetical protein